MAPDPLAPVTISNSIANLLPLNPDTGLKTPYEAIALTCHACLTSLDFRLRGLDEDSSLESTNGIRLPPEWTAHSASNTFAFRYSHPQSAMQYMLKISRLGKKALIHGIGMGDDKTASCEVVVSDFVAERPVITQADAADEASDFRTKVFFSTSRLQSFIATLKSSVIQKLVPSLHKDGYQESAAPSSHTSASEPSRSSQPRTPNPPLDPTPARPYPFVNPLAAAPRPPNRPVPDFAPPDFEDEHELLNPAPRLNPPYPRGIEGHPLSIGEDDLRPAGLGPHDPLRAGPGRFGGLGGLGGGMYPDFSGAGRGRGDGDAPPGARWDPVDPRQGMGGEGGPPNPFGGFGGGDFV